MPSFVLFLSLFFLLASASKLVYVDKARDDVGMVASWAKGHDVRGDYDNFMLVVVSDDDVSTGHVIFAEFDNTRFTYFVARHSVLPGSYDEDGSIFAFPNVVVIDAYVFVVEKQLEESFVDSIPPYFEISRVPESPIRPVVASKYDSLKIPTSADPKILEYISQVNAADLKNFVTYLSGEASTIETRQSKSQGALAAQEWLVGQFTSFGFQVTTQFFRTDYSSNVVATLPGSDKSKLVLVTCHYDSRSTDSASKTQRAPGANDNGSGTGTLLQIAKLIFQNKITFDYTVILTAFSGEEQGRFGSAFAAAQYAEQGADIVAVLNVDMIAYRATSTNQVAFASQKSSSALISQLKNITQLYVPHLSVGTTRVCCFDHANFYSEGFRATSFFESVTMTDPQYHQSGDFVARPGYSLYEQYPMTVKAVFASLLTIAQYKS